MPEVQVFEEDENKPAFVADFDFLPRVGEYISHDADGCFRYLNVVEVWHCGAPATNRFTACIRVELDD
jgi:hypothetical protein